MLTLLLAAGITLEAAGGAAQPGRSGGEGNYPDAPLFGFRAGLDPGNHLEPGLRYLVLAGREGRDRIQDGSGPDPSGFEAQSLLADLRLQSGGQRAQVFAGLGLGLGKLTRLQCTCTEHNAYLGKLGPAGQISAGLRIALPLHLWLGVEVAALAFSRVDWGANGLINNPPAPPKTNQLEWASALLFSLSLRLPAVAER